MPVPAPEDFWKLVAASKLVDPGLLESLQREFEGLPFPPMAATAGPADRTPLIAKWLVKRRVLSGWQAKHLARGERGPFFIGDYRLFERLETGYVSGNQSALLFRAKHEPSGRTVCLSLLNAALCKRLDIWTTIAHRTKSAHEVADPMVSRTWALEQSESHRFLVCEDVVGTPLIESIGRSGPLAIAAAGPLIVAIVRAVAELHRLGIVHGAVSLDVLSCEPPQPNGEAGSGRMRLLQFPLVADPHAVLQRPPVDSPAAIAQLGARACFVAPELVLPGRICTTQSDVYALGCVFHALLTGSLPCWQGDPKRTLTQAAFVGVPPLGPPQVPVEIATLVSYMVAIDPALRYPTAVEAADAIAACLGLPAVSPTLPPQRPFLFAPKGQPTAATPAGPRSAERKGSPPLVSVVARTTGSIATQAESLAVRRRVARLRLIGLCSVGGSVAALALGVGLWSLRPDPQPEIPSSTHTATVQREPLPTHIQDPDVPLAPSVTPMRKPDSLKGSPSTAPIAAHPTTLVDSSDLPWGSPTQGQPPTLAYLPPGSQLILLARPADLVARDEGLLFVRSLGPRVAHAIELLTRICGCQLNGIEEIQAGWQAGGPDEVIGGYAVRGLEPFPISDDPAAQQTAWGATEAEEVGGETLHKATSLTYWLPAKSEGRVLVVAPQKLIKSMLEASASTTNATGSQASIREGWRDKLEASLPRDMEELVGMLDSTRHLTLLGSPHYLQYDGRPILAGSLEKLIEPLGTFCGTSLQAGAISVHVGESFFLEFDALETADTPPKKLAEILAGKIAALAGWVEEYCNAIEPHPYGRTLVRRLPSMLRFLAANIRVGAEGKGVVANAYLPEHAAHNLTLAIELALEQSPGQTSAGGVVRPPASPQGALGKLQKKITLTFARDTLEKSIQMIAEEIGVPIEILGTDLQLDGITKNQSFGLEERDQTADAILRAILAKSNTDGKLVFVVRSKNGVESIEITTRAAVAKRGDTLPPGFATPAVQAKDGKKKPSDKEAVQ